MSKTCSRCEKSVYPTEELKCLDKVWHKTCFKCQTCNMTLNMKTYKGFNKLPYCEAHIPKAKATTVVETPEMRRLAENTKLQSQVQYHADFEKAKGKFTQVADDPETLRIKANSKIISNVSYHGELEKKAAMEQKRTLTGDDEANGHDDSGSVEAVSPVPIAEVIPHHPRTALPAHISPPQYHQQLQQQQLKQQQQQQQHYQQQQQHQYHYQQPQPQQPISHHSRQPDPVKTNIVSSPPRAVVPTNSDSPYSSRQTASSTLVYSSQPNALDVDEMVEYVWQHGTNRAVPIAHSGRAARYGPAPSQPQGRRVGSISDYDPVNENHGSVTQQPYRQPMPQQQQPQYSQQQTQQQKLQQYYQQQQRQHAMHLQQQQAQQQQAIQQQQAMQQLQHQQAMQQQNHFAGSVGVSSGYHQSASTQPRATGGRSYRAMYDYDADDDDEVSFRDGDVIVDCKSIDEGWMMGTVARTGRSGMVPANYIEPIN